jgi:hypothetical protein
MHIRHLLAVLLLILLLPVMAQNSDEDSKHTKQYPSEALLEFLAEFGDVDEETFQLIEFHALQDTASAFQEKPDEN